MKFAFLHYLPLEYYPPVTNLIDYLAGERMDNFKKIKIYSSHNVKGRSEYQPRKLIANSQQLPAISRSPFPKETDNSLIRLFKYLHYNILTLIGLITCRPNNLLYYESYSAWPAYVYTRYFNRKCRLFIHFHEYASKAWYRTTMRQVRYFHRLEKKWLFPRAEWISQTNEDRLQLFHQDHPYLKFGQLKIMPNYPPKVWQNLRSKLHDASPPSVLKMVYVGSISFQSTYIREVCQWVNTLEGKVLIDIYAFNLHRDVLEFLKSLNSPFIRFFDQGIEYNAQPTVLSKYQVGLILYKAHNLNYTYNAPNKLFEYLACGLDVWYPAVLHGPRPYQTSNTYPKVTSVDFENLMAFDWAAAIDRSGCSNQPSVYYCEEVYKVLVDAMIGK